MLQPAQGRSRGSAPSFSSAPHFSRSAGNSSSRPRSFSGAARFNSPAARFSSQAAFRNRTFSRSGPSTRFSSQATFRSRVASGPRLAVTRATADNPRIDSRFASRSSATRAAALRPQAFNENSRVIARHSANQHPNWDRRRDHFWHGHRCHWHHNSWVIFGLGFYPAFYPWGWDYGYPYSYYYDDRSYEDGYAANEYPQSEYDSRDASVSQVQTALARGGYYRGAIDGSVGPATRNALRRFQSSHGLDATGRIDQAVVEALGLR